MSSKSPVLLGLISDIFKVRNLLKLKRLLLTLDIEKVFDCVNQSFILTLLKSYGFNQDFKSGLVFCSKIWNRAL